MHKHLTLYGRTYCHLCDDMAAALQPLLNAHHATLHVVDVDQHPHIEAHYDELVPVLVGGQPQDWHPEMAEICHYFVDVAKVEAYLSR